MGEVNGMPGPLKENASVDPGGKSGMCLWALLSVVRLGDRTEGYGR